MGYLVELVLGSYSSKEGLKPFSSAIITLRGPNLKGLGPYEVMQLGIFLLQSNNYPIECLYSNY